MFEDTGWDKRVDIGDVLFENRWPEGIGGTPTAY
jgi:5,6-dimethylbenzimidazole synthase